MTPPQAAPAQAIPEKEIRLLDPQTINQIAAGEVVERPASALKELIENALDAGATRVDITLAQAGTRLIEVADDGCGMSAEMARMALLRHATSKIQAIEDLSRVETMGFRGEAIPAIASVSRMTLSTGTGAGARSVLSVAGGAVAEERAEAGPRGTTIRVEDLFWNTPARLKFLKSDASELAACVEVASKAAVARPDVRVSLRHEGQMLIQTPGSGRLLDAVAEAWGRDAARALAPVDQLTGACRVRGLVSPPHFTKPSRTHQWLFVNGRPMRSRALAAALDQASRSFTPEKRYLLAVLMLDVDPSTIDVNVSPTKSEVKFHKEGAVFDAVRRSVQEALMATGMVPDASSLAEVNRALAPPSPDLFSQPPAGGVGAFAASMAAQAPWAGSSPGAAPSSLEEPVEPEPASRTRLPSLMDGLRVLGQADLTFIIAENDSGLLIVDQHVAHERIIYERLKNTRGSVPVEVQPLLTPEAIPLDRRSMEEVRPRLEELKQIGFDVEPFGSDTLLVRSVPALSRSRSPLAILKDILDQLADGMAEGCAAPARDEVYILASCKMAIKAGDPMGLREMEQLLADLALTENPYFCPHGRPITILIPKGDLRRRFKR